MVGNKRRLGFGIQSHEGLKLVSLLISVLRIGKAYSLVDNAKKQETRETDHC